VVTVKSLVREHKPAVIRFYLDYRAVPKGNPMTADKRDSRTHARYLYTTDLSLSEEVEEACLAGDRGAPQGRQGPGTAHPRGGRGFRATLPSSPS